MAAPHALPLTIAALTDAQPPLRLFYVKADDGLFHLQTDGVHPDSVKLTEFRDNNRALAKQKAELEGQLTAITTERDQHAADLATLKARPDLSQRALELESSLAAERASHDQTRFRSIVGAAVIKAGARGDAVDYLVGKAQQIFSMADGKLTTTVFSPTTPGTVLGLDEWAASERVASAFAFLGSKGAGAGTTGQGGGPPRPVVDSNDPFAFGRNLEGIATGKVDVQ